LLYITDEIMKENVDRVDRLHGMQSKSTRCLVGYHTDEVLSLNANNDTIEAEDSAEKSLLNGTCSRRWALMLE